MEITGVLVASDSPTVRAGLRAILDASGSCRVAAETGLEELAEQAAAVRPDVALIDLPSGDRDRIELLWRLAGDTPSIPLLVLSGDPSESLARESLQAGVRGYLLRDATPDEIVAAVRAVSLGMTVLHPATSHAIVTRPLPPASGPASDPLTSRELEVLQAMAQGLPSKTIAARLGISEHTVKFHVSSILGKLGAASRTEAVALAIRQGLLAV